MPVNESQKILIISTLLKIQKTLALTPEELCAMSGNLPDVSFVKGKKGLYDRLFDREKIFGIAGQDADGNPLYNVQTTLLADKTLDKISTLITAGLGITETELLELLEFLGRDTTADQIIDHTLLSDLYRHARIARGLKLSITDFIGSATLALNATPLFGIEDIQSLLEFAAWRKTSVFSVEELEIICEGTEGKTIKYQYTAERLAAAILEIQSSDQVDKKKLLKEFLQQQFNLTESQLDNEYLIKLTSVDLDNAGIATALSASFTNGIPDNINDFNTLRDLAHELERYTLLWKQLDMTAETVSYVLAEKDVFAVTDWKALTLENLKNLNNYTAIIKQDREMEKDTQQALRSYQTTGEFSADDIKILSSLFDQPQELIHSLSKTLTLSSVGIEALNYINQVQTVCGILGIDGYSLQKLTAITSSELLNASNIMLGALASRYEDEKTRTEKLESLTDQINTQKRDALCDYIISHREKFKFKDRNDLYQFFLLDVEMGGCFRTSRIVCAISSVQIYINRCLTNLEQSDPYLNPAIKDIKVNPTWIPADEWGWRKNYRVWEANRKVFLYPENYIDPTLRDNKTHIFKELEDNLLQQKITQETSENAYKKYLAQFSELSRLRYAGSFSKAPPFVWAGLMLNDIEKNAAKKDDDISLMLTENMFGMEAFDSDRGKIGMHQFFLSEKADKNIYYLFARTNVSPYQYYYRTYQHSGAIWGNWIKMDLPIEAEEISTLMHQGKLYIFWNEVKSKEINKIKAGNAQSSGVNF
ncbi:MAG: hypothetical protein KAS59_08365, partial [Alphaproteobacteria bacterium]|nr:hypothetical protein [Alphaproteobacteria bacterium]